MSQTKDIWVYADWYMYDSPRLVGKLSFSALRGKAVYSFEYDKEWIKSGIAIDPELPLFSGVHYAASNENFGIFKDSSPDRWGQLLMKRREVLLSKIENRDPKPLFGIDFLLGVHDSHRMGGLRFKNSEAGWTLSPAFDINANETGTGLKLNIDEYDNSLDLDLVMKIAPYYLLLDIRAEEIKGEIISAVSQWKKVATKYKAAPSEIERKSRAFKTF